jgi:hypothetical protein
MLPDRTRRLACRALALPFALAAAGTLAPGRALGAAPDAPALERRVKAAFLYKFLGYAEFPPNAFTEAGGPLLIAVVGSDEMVAELVRITAGRVVAGRPIVVRKVGENEPLPPAHLLFVAGGDGERCARVLRAASVAFLTVTECEGGLRQGSVINFRIIDERVRFDVSLDAADRKNVKLSSRLLTVANRVQKGGS